MNSQIDVAVIGGGQAALAVGYFLRRRTSLNFVLLDNQVVPGGAWLHGWDSLRLFSPARWSSLPGWGFPPPAGSDTESLPARDDVLHYLSAYEQRYDLPVVRPVQVTGVEDSGERLSVETDHGAWSARVVVSATGTWSNPYIPHYPGQEDFRGEQIHSAHYRSAESWKGRRVLVIGGGNSGAQILSEVSRVAHATWVTQTPPRFLPDDVDGRVLFEQATREFTASQVPGVGSAETSRVIAVGENPLGAIVMVPPVREARERGILHSVPPFVRFTPRGVVWEDGTETPIDIVVWCTGFRPALDHLSTLNIWEENGQIAVENARCRKEPRLWLLGYGDWCGFGSATLYGVGKLARQSVEEIQNFLV